jgi:hypothetical protein
LFLRLRIRIADTTNFGSGHAGLGGIPSDCQWTGNRNRCCN